MPDANAAPTDTRPDTRPDAKPDTAHYQRVLAAMVDLAASVAHKLAARIDDATPAEAADLAGAFERVTRIVRRTILLSVHLDKAAEKQAAARADALRVELVERLDAPDLAPELDREIALRPLADIILDVQRDMGLADIPYTPPWPRRTPDDVADLLARARRPTQPWPPHSPWQLPPNAPS